MALTIDNRGHWRGLDCSGQQPRYEAIRRHLHGSVLDIGCGTGILAEHCGYYTGVEPALEAARTAAASGAEIYNTSAEAFDLQGREWDVVLFNESLYYSSRPLALLAKYRRALRPGGKMIISIFLRPSSRRLPFWITRRMDNVRCTTLVERFVAGIAGRVEREDVPIGTSYWRIWVIRPAHEPRRLDDGMAAQWAAPLYLRSR